MSYPAHVIDEAYLYDGSFPGFLCCVFESYARKEIPAAVLGPGEGQLTIFGNRSIVTDATRARRVAVGLSRQGGEVKDWVYTGFLSSEPDKDLTLLRFARLSFEYGSAVTTMMGDPDVAAAFALARSVHNEAGKYVEFIRFEQRGRMLGTVIHPRHAVLPLLRAHFCSRLPDEDFLIFDATHGTAMLRQGGKVQYLTMQHYEPAKDEAEQDWQTLWKHFFKALTIEERRSEKRQMSHVPKHFWQDMCEMQPDFSTRSD